VSPAPTAAASTVVSPPRILNRRVERRVPPPTLIIEARPAAPIAEPPTPAMRATAARVIAPAPVNVSEDDPLRLKPPSHTPSASDGHDDTDMSLKEPY
jgi:hypothetical protein